MTGNEVAKACDIWHTQVTRYAARLHIKPVGTSGRATLWPARLAAEISRLRRTAADPREGGEADEFWRDGDTLFIGRLRSDGRRRTLARIRLTAATRSRITGLLGTPTA